MTVLRIRTTLTRAAVLAAILIVPGCASSSFSIWPRPLTVPNEARPWPRPDYPGPMELDEVREALLTYHNRARAEKSRGRLTIDPALQEAAQAHAEEMADRRKMTHSGADGSSSADRIAAAGYAYRRCGENIAYGQYTPELVMRGWLTSPPHRRNILGAFSQIGLGYATDKDGTPYWCVTFGSPAPR